MCIETFGCIYHLETKYDTVYIGIQSKYFGSYPYIIHDLCVGYYHCKSTIY